MSGKNQPNRNIRRAVKRPAPPVFMAAPTSHQEKDNDFLCPICFEMIDEAYMTKCGHSFCNACIEQSLEHNNRCPKCNFSIEKKDDIFPNFSLNELIQRHRNRLADLKRARTEVQASALSPSAASLIMEQDHLDLPHVNMLLSVLTKKKHQLEGDSEMAQTQILKDFLAQIRQKKQQQMDDLQAQLCTIDSDLLSVEGKFEDFRKLQEQTVATMGEDPNGTEFSVVPNPETGSQDGFNGSKNAGKQWLHTTMASRRKKVFDHFKDLESCYFDIRQPHLIPGTSPNIKEEDKHSLNVFTESLSKFTRFTSLRSLATLSYASDLYNSSSIVSSIEFDRDADYFAIAGVTKKIKIFEYGPVIRDTVEVHHPVTEMVCNSKISSVIWSDYHKGLLASSDYEGTVTLWDACTGLKSKVFQEHEKRCWSVDFNSMDPNLLASGSDDSRVKLWYTNQDHSVMSIEAKANVCCVKFNPKSRYHIAFGSADHCVHYYDLRNPKQALAIFKGHRKAVSYTKFVSSNEIVSASTDSQLKLWNIEQNICSRTFKGHTNEKNFVGLATDGDYVACGSENNSLYVYYKGLSKQLLTYKFDAVRSVLEKERKEEETNEFVSAVCWRPGSNVVVAANSQGMIKVLELV